MTNRMSGTAELVVPASHPALPGHFPAAPLVPGALLLAETLSRVESASGTALNCMRVLSAKFLKPVGPDEVLTIQYQGEESHTTSQKATFTIFTGEIPVAQFILELALAPRHDHSA